MATKIKVPKYERVMIIDDSEIDNFINQKMIEGSGFSNKVYVHTGSKSALEFFRNMDVVGSLSANLLPQIIFLDINMPMMDGFQFIDEYEKLASKLNTKIKIVMLTTSINPDDVERANTNKFVSKFINKPLTEKILSEL